MKFYCELYWSDTLKEKQDKILSKLRRNRLQRDTYLITLANHSGNHLEIFDSVFLKQKIINRKDLLVVGIGDGYADALQLVETITQEVYDQTGGADIRRYLLEKQRKFDEGIG